MTLIHFILVLIDLCLVLMGITAVMHARRIDQLAERLDKLGALLLPIIEREKGAKLTALSFGLDGLAEMLEDAGKDDPKVKNALAPHVENLRGSAQKIKGSKSK